MEYKWPQYRNLIINISTIVDEETHENMIADIEKLLKEKYNYAQFSRRFGKDEMCEVALLDEVTFCHRDVF